MAAAVKTPGRHITDRDRYDSDVRKRYQQRSQPRQQEEPTGNFLTKLADMASLSHRMQQSANMQMYGNANIKKMGEIMDRENERMIKNSRDELSYVGERAVVGAADKLEGLINALGYGGQALNRTQQLQNSQDAAMWAALTDSDTQRSLSERLEDTAMESVRSGLQDTTRFGDNYRADVENRYADSHISKLGRIAGDVSEAVGSMLPSVLTKVIAPGVDVAANVVNAISTLGNSMQEAKKSGANDLRAMGYGIFNAGTEFFGEKLADGLMGLYGKGSLDDVIEKTVEKYLTNETARKLGIAGGKVFVEGAEEFLSEIGNRIGNEWLIDTDDRTFRETLMDGLYNALISMFISSSAQAGGSVANADRPQTNTAAPAADIAVRPRTDTSSIADIDARAREGDFSGYVDLMRDLSNNKRLRDLQKVYEEEWKQFQESRRASQGQEIHQKNVEQNQPNVPVDSKSAAGYDEIKGVDINGEKEVATSEGTSGAFVRAKGGNEGVGSGIPGSGKEEVARTWSETERTNGKNEVAEWAKGHIVDQAINSSPVIALDIARGYFPDVYIVEDAALKARRPNAWATTSNGKIYISDALPSGLEEIVGYHEIVHVVKQKGSLKYQEFINQMNQKIDFRNAGILDVILKSRFGKQDLLDLSDKQIDLLYDELNAVVWGYYKADPENAKEQFSEMFVNYGQYIAELDLIMEEFKDLNHRQWEE